MWLYVGVPLTVVPLAVFRGWVPGAVPARSWWGVAFRPIFSRGVWAALVLLAAAVGVVLFMMERARAADPSIALIPADALPPERWADQYAEFARLLFTFPGVTELAVLLGAVAVLGAGWGLWKRRAVLAVTAGRVLPAVLAAAGEYAFLGTRKWVAWNSCHPRYLVAVGTAVTLAAVLVGLVPLLDALPRRWFRATAVAAGVLLLAVAIGRFGWPAPDVPRRILDERFGELTADLLAAEVDGVGGDYWQVWPAVLNLNTALCERGERRVVWGVTKRSGPWQHRWRGTGRTYRVGVWKESGREGEDWPGEAQTRGLEVVRELTPVGRVRVWEVRAE